MRSVTSCFNRTWAALQYPADNALLLLLISLWTSRSWLFFLMSEHTTYLFPWKYFSVQNSADLCRKHFPFPLKPVPGISSQALLLILVFLATIILQLTSNQPFNILSNIMFLPFRERQIKETWEWCKLTLAHAPECSAKLAQYDIWSCSFVHLLHMRNFQRICLLSVSFYNCMNDNSWLKRDGSRGMLLLLELGMPVPSGLHCLTLGGCRWLSLAQYCRFYPGLEAYDTFIWFWDVHVVEWQRCCSAVQRHLHGEQKLLCLF